jgi:hypothetical protein
MSQLENKKSPLDPSSALRMRTELHKMVVADLLGPAGGEEEIVEEASVRSRYVVGLLAPKGQSVLPDEEDEGLAVAGTDTQDGKPSSPIASAPAMLPSSMGFTFSVSAQAQTIQITARWGHYQRARSETLKDDKGEFKLIWKRQQIEAQSAPIPLKAGRIEKWIPNKDFPEIKVNGLIRKYPNTWTVTLFLINGQEEPKTNKDEAWVFQPELIARHPAGESIFVQRGINIKLTEDTETQAMSMSYRRQVEFAVGHGVGIHAEKQAGEWDRACEIRTTVIPAYEVEQVDAPSVREIPALEKVQLDMSALAKQDGNGLISALMPLADAYEEWIVEQESIAASPPPDLVPYIQSAHAALETCRTTLSRIRDGINLLAADEKAAEAFRFANQAMAQQRIRSIYTREARQKENVTVEEYDIPKNRSWRPFQLAFMLLNIPALVDPTHPDRVDPTFAKADLLWFPTGGGKTEAYLGVAAFTIGLRRLQGDMGGYSGAAAVTVIMRYTLRLLTLQQFQRATALICACELLRRADEAQWGKEPFRIGLWVGRKSTPNTTENSAKVIRQGHGMWNGLGSVGTPIQLTNCPWCGKPIGANDVKVELFNAGRGRTIQYCSDPLGTCAFSKRQSPEEGLPIVVVDEEIYRRLPTLLIATVDKFAQMPWKGETQMLFGKVNGYCPRHGWRSPSLEDSDSHPAIKNNAEKFPAVKTKPHSPLRPPDLIIQDELHLISGPLGTLVGLYETAVDRLCSWDYKSVRVRPKVIASTATIRQANQQVHNLFLREVQIFPPSGLEAGNNFFSRRRPASPEAPGRLYLGICAPGTRMKTILIRAYVAYLSAAQKLYNENGKYADPWMTLVGYFNSMRELGGMRRVTDDAVRTRLRTMDERGLSKRYIESDRIEELTSRKSATDIPRILDRLESVFEPPVEGKKNPKAAPYDVVLATNMISVGVDVNRLGLMIVASQPKATSEYIQATSRVGRAFPGMVCTVYNWARPRDLSHFERFEHYHATFYKQVEALSVTPFSPRALDRGLSGVYVSLVRLLENEFNKNENAGKVSLPNDLITAVEKEISHRAGVVAIKGKTEDLVKAMLKSRRDEWQNRASTTLDGGILSYNKYGSDRAVPLLKQPTEEAETLFFCLNSLRDVEPQIKLLLNDHDMDNEPEIKIEENSAQEGRE